MKRAIIQFACAIFVVSFACANEKNLADNFNSNETSSLYSAIPLSSEFGNCNSLLSQLIEIAGGNFDASKLPWDAIGWSHRMKSNLFEK